MSFKNLKFCCENRSTLIFRNVPACCLSKPTNSSKKKKKKGTPVQIFFITRGEKLQNQHFQVNNSMKHCDMQLIQILIKGPLGWACRIFSKLQQWLYMHGWSWRGHICTLVTGHQNTNMSDQTHSSVWPAYQLLLSAWKASEEGFIVTYWQFKAKLSLL